MMKKKILFIVIIFAVLLAIVFFITKSLREKPKTIPIEKPVLVRTQAVKTANIPLVIKAVGMLTAAEQTNISAESDGYVKEVLFDGGKYVKKDDILLKLDDVKAAADLVSVKASYQVAESKYERSVKLQKKGFISKQEIDSIYSDMKNNLSKVLETQDTLNQKTIRAPFSGYLGKRTVSVGDYIASGQKIVDLVNREQLQIDYSVPEQVLNQLKIGQSVEISVNAMPNELFAGVVSFISPTVDEQTHTVALQATIPNQKNLLAPGLSSTIKQVLHQKRWVMLIPAQAVIRTLENTSVFKVVNGKAQLASIKIGDLVDGDVEVLSGLTAKDTVITEGQNKVKEGDSVTVS
jgi:membrane fusion protein (multidrug efflux system)